jgi:hypothetical protein
MFKGIISHFHHCKKLIIIDHAVFIYIALTNHLLNKRVVKAIFVIAHYLPKLLNRDVSAVVPVEIIERLQYIFLSKIYLGLHAASQELGIVYPAVSVGVHLVEHLFNILLWEIVRKFIYNLDEFIVLDPTVTIQVD